MAQHTATLLTVRAWSEDLDAKEIQIRKDLIVQERLRLQLALTMMLDKLELGGCIITGKEADALESIDFFIDNFFATYTDADQEKLR